MRQIILDTETTGLSTREGHRVLEIGCLELEDRRPTGRTLHLYLNPERDIDEGALKVHGISQAFLADKPVFADVVDDVLAFLEGGELVAHNAPFDVGFLNYELQLLGRQDSIEQHCQVLDTLVLAKHKHPGQRNSLDALCKRYGIDNSSRELHGALLDAQLLSNVYLLMTGGQTSLLQDSDKNGDAIRQLSPAQLPTRANPRVVRATEDELKRHQDFLSLLESNNEKSLWLH